MIPGKRDIPVTRLILWLVYVTTFHLLDMSNFFGKIVSFNFVSLPCLEESEQVDLQDSALSNTGVHDDVLQPARKRLYSRPVPVLESQKARAAAKPFFQCWLWTLLVVQGRVCKTEVWIQQYASFGGERVLLHKPSMSVQAVRVFSEVPTADLSSTKWLLKVLLDHSNPSAPVSVSHLVSKECPSGINIVRGRPRLRTAVVRKPWPETRM